MTNNQITLNQIRCMTDEQILDLCHKFPYKSQWDNSEAYNHAEYTIALIQGNQYQKTGNINSFKRNSL